MDNFKIVDINTLGRAMHYHYFMDTGTSLEMTVKIEVTKAVEKCKAENLSFYAYSIYSITRLVNLIENMRYDLKDNELILWDELVPTFTHINQKTKLFYALWIKNENNYWDFDNNFKALIEKYKNANTIAPMLDMPQNIVSISSLPWTHFDSFSSQNKNSSTTLLPMITMGKYANSNGKLLLPVTLKVHHATMDGYHMSVFFEKLQEQMNK